MYWLVAFVGRPALFVAWPVGMVGLLIYLKRRDLRPIRLTLERAHLALVAVLTLGVIVLMRVPLFFGNLTIAADGGMTVVPISDALLHVAIGHELTHTVPPQNPVFAGQALSRHYGGDLVTAMMARATGLTVADLTVRVVPTLQVISGMLAVFCFSRRWLGSIGFAALTVFLVFFGEDLAFIPGYLRGWDFDWTTAFNVPSVFSLFYVNPMLPALALLFVGLFCLHKYLDAPDYAWLALSAICFAALAEVKVFTGAHILGAMGAAALVFVVYRRFELLKVTGLTVVLMAPLMLSMVLQNLAGARIQVVPGAAGYVDGAVRRLGLQESVTGAPALLLVGLPLFLIASLGLRLAGGWAILRSLLQPIASGPLRFMLAVFVVAGIVMTLLLRIVPEGISGYDNGVWFFVQSKFVMWIFAVEILRHWYDRLGSLTRAPALAGILIAVPAVAIAAPSTVQHFRVLAEEAAASDPEATAAARFLASKVQPGDVVLVNQAVAGRVVALAPVRLPVGYFADTMVSADLYKRREARVLDFWRVWESGAIRTDVLRDLGVRYVSAIEPDNLRVPSEMVEIYSQSGYVVLELRD